MRSSCVFLRRLPAFALILTASCATAQPPAPAAVPKTMLSCDFGSEARAIETLEALPASVRDELAPIAAKGERFNSIDVIVPGVPGRRFVRAGQSGELYYIWYEQGGIFYSTRLAVYRVRANAKAELVTQRIETGTPCRTTGDAVGAPAN